METWTAQESDNWTGLLRNPSENFESLRQANAVSEECEQARLEQSLSAVQTAAKLAASRSADILRARAERVSTRNLERARAQQARYTNILHTAANRSESLRRQTQVYPLVEPVAIALHLEASVRHHKLGF